jgi:hypothetical protein
VPQQSKEGRDYLSLKLDDPSFTAPIFANLFDDPDGEVLHPRLLVLSHEGWRVSRCSQASPGRGRGNQCHARESRDTDETGADKSKGHTPTFVCHADPSQAMRQVIAREHRRDGIEQSDSGPDEWRASGSESEPPKRQRDTGSKGTCTEGNHDA